MMVVGYKYGAETVERSHRLTNYSIDCLVSVTESKPGLAWTGLARAGGELDWATGLDRSIFGASVPPPSYPHATLAFPPHPHCCCCPRCLAHHTPLVDSSSAQPQFKIIARLARLARLAVWPHTHRPAPAALVGWRWVCVCLLGQDRDAAAKAAAVPRLSILTRLLRNRTFSPLSLLHLALALHCLASDTLHTIRQKTNVQ